MVYIHLSRSLYIYFTYSDTIFHINFIHAYIFWVKTMPYWYTLKWKCYPFIYWMAWKVYPISDDVYIFMYLYYQSYIPGGLYQWPIRHIWSGTEMLINRLREQAAWVCIWSILLIKSGLKWRIHLGRSLFSYSYMYEYRNTITEKLDDPHLIDPSIFLDRVVLHFFWRPFKICVRDEKNG